MKIVRASQDSVPEEEYKIYQQFCGMDLSSDFDQAGNMYCNVMQNMVLGEDGYPEVRKGYMRVTKLNMPIYGIHALPESEQMIIHAGNRIYCMNTSGSMSSIGSGANTDFSTSFSMNGYLYLLDGKKYRCIQQVGDAWRAKYVSDIAYIPITTANATPSGTGTKFEAANLLTPKRINTFVGNGSAVQFQLDIKDIDTTGVSVTVDGAAVSVASVNAQTGVVTLAATPASGSKVAITFSKTITGALNKIDKCTVYGVYTSSVGSYIFLSGNADYSATEWCSSPDNPAYFPETQKIQVGNSDYPIMNFVNDANELLIVKQDNQQENTIWRNVIEGNNIDLQSCVSNIGAIAKYSVRNFNGKPLFLNLNGVYSLSCNYYENTFSCDIKCISNRINMKLLNESGIENAMCAIWKNYYLISMDDCIIVADSSYVSSMGEPAWYYWINMPAKSFMVTKNNLYFGTSDGKVCVIKNDKNIASDGSDITYSDEGNDIIWEWRSKLIFDLSLTGVERRKLDSGNGVIIKKVTRSYYELTLNDSMYELIPEHFVTVNEEKFIFGEENAEQFTFDWEYPLSNISIIGVADNELMKIYLVSLHYSLEKSDTPPPVEPSPVDPPPDPPDI